MDDKDLAHNFQRNRTRYWIRKGLSLPQVAAVFDKITMPRDIGKPAPVATFMPWDMKIVIIPAMRHLYFAVHITLLHEMAHVYLELERGYVGHGKPFQREIDRLYALGAFRKLI